MIINRLSLIDGARQATGLTVIIDVFRAFSSACYAIDQGADKIIVVGSVEEALELKELDPNLILMGEVMGIKPEKFDTGNSPSENQNINFQNKTVVQRTSAGTQGIVNAIKTDEIITGSFVNAQAVIKYIKQKNPTELSLVAMGSAGVEIRDEDEYCAEFIEKSLNDEVIDFDHYVQVC